MGKQIRFYMTDEDENEFIAFVRSIGDVAILPQATREEKGEVFASFRELVGRELGESCHLWNRSLSPAPLVRHIPDHQYYWLDFMQSEVVNVWPCKMLPRNQLSMGRLHIETTFLCPDGSIVAKGAPFLDWFDRLCKWVRKNYRRKLDGAHVSPRVHALAAEGISLVDHWVGVQPNQSQ